MNNKESLINIEKENELIKTLFSFTKFQEKKSAERIYQILSFIQNSKNGPNYLIKLVDHFSLCRPHNPDLSKLFVKCIFFCFPETNEENKTFIKDRTEALKYFIFPEEFQQKPTNGSSQKNQEFEKKMKDLFSLLQEDDENS